MHSNPMISARIAWKVDENWAWKDCQHVLKFSVETSFLKSWQASTWALHHRLFWTFLLLTFFQCVAGLVASTLCRDFIEDTTQDVKVREDVYRPWHAMAGKYPPGSSEATCLTAIICHPLPALRLIIVLLCKGLSRYAKMIKVGVAMCLFNSHHV